MERDDDIKGSGNSYDFGARMYDSRLGRWLSMDPKSKSQPQWSAFKAMNDNPIIFDDPNGEREYLTIVIRDNDGHEIILQKQVSYRVMSGKPYENYVGGSSHQNVDYYDFERVIYVDINNSTGKSSVRSEINLLDNYPKRDTDSRLPFQDVRAGQLKTDFHDFVVNAEFGWEGEGSSQNSGFHLVSEAGGESPTKVKATEGAGQSINVDYLMAAVSTVAKSLNLPKITEGSDAVVAAVSEALSDDSNSKGRNEGSFSVKVCNQCHRPVKDTSGHPTFGLGFRDSTIKK